MPRVKAITTGSVPSFADVILNIAESETMSTLANQDTWLRQLRERPDGRLVMYGDDTWLNLFPGMFDRYDGTSSFFVSVGLRARLSNAPGLRTDPLPRTLLKLTTTSRVMFQTSCEWMTGQL